MTLRELKLTCLLIVGLFVVACDDSPKENQKRELVDAKGTAHINEKLLAAMNAISKQQLDQVEEAGKQALEQLSEADRQLLIDLTIEESSKLVLKKGEKVVDRIENSQGISIK